MSTTTAHKAKRAARPLLGLRRRPGRLALVFMRLPLRLYRRGWGRWLGHTFLLITHEGRRTGKHHQTVAMAATWNPTTREVIVCSAWGETQWLRNLRAHPAPEIQIGDEAFVPEQRFLTEDEAVTAAISFRDHHPWRMHLFRTILGWRDLDTDTGVREFVRTRPFISFRPLPPDSPPPPRHDRPAAVDTEETR